MPGWGTGLPGYPPGPKWGPAWGGIWAPWVGVCPYERGVIPGYGCLIPGPPGDWPIWAMWGGRWPGPWGVPLGIMFLYGLPIPLCIPSQTKSSRGPKIKCAKQNPNLKCVLWNQKNIKAEPAFKIYHTKLKNFVAVITFWYNRWWQLNKTLAMQAIHNIHAKQVTQLQKCQIKISVNCSISEQKSL